MMNPNERHRRVKELFEAAVRLPSEDRSAFLSEHCGADDPALCAEVESLIAHHHVATTGFLQSPEHSLESGVVASASTSTNDDAPDPLINQHIGSYRINRVIGTGGMGKVYEAEQDSPRRKPVSTAIR